MHVSGRTRGLRACRPSSGFSLLEVVIASGLLLMTITAVTLCMTSVSASGARFQGAMDADRAVRRVAERLAALPFCGSDADAGAAPGAEVEDLLGAVFPHADAARNTPTARYVTIGEDEAPAGTFVSVFIEGGVDVRCVARFLVDEGGAPLEPAAVAGWEQAEGDQPPACALSVDLSATSHGSLRTAGFTRAALATVPVKPMPTAGPT